MLIVGLVAATPGKGSSAAANLNQRALAVGIAIKCLLVAIGTYHLIGVVRLRLFFQVAIVDSTRRASEERHVSREVI